MRKYKFSNAEKYSIWSQHESKCYWCGEPLRFSNTTIDHVIPEYLIDKPEDLNKILNEYGLEPSFKINSFANWLPCHDRCNKSKGKYCLTFTPGTKSLLERLAKSESDVLKRSQKIKENKNIDRLVGKFIVAVESGSFSGQEAREIIETLKDIDDDDFRSLENEVWFCVEAPAQFSALSERVETVEQLLDDLSKLKIDAAGFISPDVLGDI